MRRDIMKYRDFFISHQVMFESKLLCIIERMLKSTTMKDSQMSVHKGERGNTRKEEKREWVRVKI